MDWGFDLPDHLDGLDHVTVPDGHIVGHLDIDHDGIPELSSGGVLDLNHDGIPEGHDGLWDFNHDGIPELSHSGVLDVNHDGILESTTSGMLDTNHDGIPEGLLSFGPDHLDPFISNSLSEFHSLGGAHGLALPDPFSA